MSSYIKSEFYRLMHNKKAYIFIAICSLLLISVNVLLRVVKHFEPTFPYGNTSFSLGTFMSSGFYIFVLCITVVSIAFGDEYSNHTMKNSVSFGLT